MHAAAASLFFCLLLYLILTLKGMDMFKKRNQETVEKTLAGAPTQAAVPPAEDLPDVSAHSARRSTVIAQGVIITGNIEIEGDIHIYGKVLGNITLTDGIVHVMRDGYIEGEFTAPTMMINGRVQGVCTGEKIELLEHGEMDGVIRSAAFSIRPGGCFTGSSERLPMEKQASEHPAKTKKGQREKPGENPVHLSLAQS